MSTAEQKVPVVCPSCNKRLLVPASSLGKQARCPACKEIFPLEQVFEAETVQPPANDFSSSFAPASNSWGTHAAPSPQPAYPQQQFPANDVWGTAMPATSSQATLTDPYASPQVSTTSYSGYQPSATPPKREFWDSSILGGIALMAISVIWFFGGLLVDIIFFYPPILFIIGLVVMIKGLVSGNIAGK